MIGIIENYHTWSNILFYFVCMLMLAILMWVGTRLIDICKRPLVRYMIATTIGILSFAEGILVALAIFWIGMHIETLIAGRLPG
jgi:hypothetical protein